jgi:hypothetical protein
VGSDLGNSKSDRGLSNVDRPSVCGTVPAIGLVYRTPSNRPSGQIQPKGWSDIDDKRKLPSSTAGMAGHWLTRCR